MTDPIPDGPATRPGDIVALHEHGPPPADFAALFLAGMERRPKSLVGAMLLDRRSPAFQRLCALPEYYVQRAELEILRDQAVPIARQVGPAAQLIDFGRGSRAQTSLLLSVLDRPWGYVAVDRDRDRLLDDARLMQQRYPRLWVEAVRADPRIGFDLPPNAGGGRRIGYLPGNAIGTFDPPEALALLSLWARELGPRGLLLIGVDLRKSVLILEAAYDDPHGLNRSLILDVLRRANRELGAGFDERMFEYRVRFDKDSGRVSNDLVSLGQHEVAIGDRRIAFGQGEAIHVEESWKYSVEDFRALARGAGFRPLQVWFDAKRLFSLHLLEAASGP
nr:L-histidine N(alpha)-methyltransferase [Sphingomonas sp. Y57]